MVAIAVAGGLVVVVVAKRWHDGGLFGMTLFCVVMRRLHHRLTVDIWCAYATYSEHTAAVCWSVVHACMTAGSCINTPRLM